MSRRFMRTRLARSHRRAGAAIESVIEKQWRNTQLLRFEFVENVMRIIRAVVVPHSRMIAAHNEMRAAVVLANQRMKDRFARTGVAHCGGDGCKNSARGGGVFGR